MSAFSPQVPPIPRPSSEALLARFVPSALRRTPPVAKLWRLPRLVVTAVLSAGFLPCVALQSRVRKVQMMHGRQCRLAAELLAGHVAGDDAAVLDEAARGVCVPFAWLTLSVVLLVMSAVCGVTWLASEAWSPDAVLRYWSRPLLPFEPLVTVSLVTLSGAYLVLVVQVNRQAVAMQQFALAFNAVCGERLGAIDPPPLVFGLASWRHLVVGAGMTYAGLVWAVPMVLAWAAFAAFVRESGYRFRVRLADRVSALGGAESVVPVADLCPNVDCRNGVPRDAWFCPRCGTAVALPAAAGRL